MKRTDVESLPMVNVYVASKLIDGRVYFDALDTIGAMRQSFRYDAASALSEIYTQSLEDLNGSKPASE